LRAVLHQPQFTPLSLGEQVALLLAVAAGAIDDLPIDRIDGFRSALAGWLTEHCPEALAISEHIAALDPALKERMIAALRGLAGSVAG
jgi:F0F1-type ATP synthase alpha subunit